MAFAIPVGVATGLYFAEYARDDLFTRILRLAIRSLAGVPSVVFGLFGLSLFVILFRFGPSLPPPLADLACLTLPLARSPHRNRPFLPCPRTTVTAPTPSEPQWQTIRRVVLPSAAPTVITGIISASARWRGDGAHHVPERGLFRPHIAESLFSEVMALPYHIYVLAGGNVHRKRPIQYGAVLVLLLLVAGICSVGIPMRSRLRRRMPIRGENNGKNTDQREKRESLLRGPGAQGRLRGHP